MKATKFYIEKFKTGYPNGKVYTYEEDKITKLLTYKNDGTENTNPIVLDDKGECEIYTDGSKTVFLSISDEYGNGVIEETIKRLEGKDGGTPDPDWEPTEAELKAKKGRTGEQGLSVIGPDGLDGLPGQQGPDAYNEVTAVNGQDINIPIGISEVFVTATAGGGSSARFTNCILMFDVVSPYSYNLSGSDDKMYVNYRYSEDATLNTLKSKNYELFTRRGLLGYYPLPGSGYAGQSVYRYKISLDKTIQNKITIFIGDGGMPDQTDATKLNGGNGGDTTVYLNDKLVLTLKGGLGGENNFPYLGTNEIYKEAKTADLSFYENAGFKRTGVYFKFNYNDDYSNDTFNILNRVNPDSRKTPFTKTTYYETWEELWHNRTVYVQIELMSFTGLTILGQSGNSQFNGLNFFTNDVKDLCGENNIFETNYTSNFTLQAASNNQSVLKSGSVKNVKLSSKYGYGVGGDTVFYTGRDYRQTINPQTGYKLSYIGNKLIAPFLDTTGSQGTFYCLIKDEILNMARRALNNFEPSASDTTAYKPGIQDSIDEDIMFANYDKWISQINQTKRSYDMIYQGPGYYKHPGFRDWASTNIGAFKPQNGTAGFAYVQFGNISDLTS